MSHTINGASLRTLPPISTISVNNFNVVFTDKECQKSIQFHNNKDTKVFLRWLLNTTVESIYA
jgi:hypothetical protein